MFLPGQREGGGAVALRERDVSPCIHPSIFRVLSNTGATRESFKSLDRSLKVFLRSSNLPGLECRLRVAGFNSLEDLAEANEDILCAHGFTPHMAQRLLTALDDYLLRQVDKSEEVLLPFQLVRKGQVIKSSPTDKMKELPTFGKQNVKRQRVSDKKPSKNKKASVNKGKPAKQPFSIVRLMSQESIPSEPIFPNVNIQPEQELEVFGTEELGAIMPGEVGGAYSAVGVASAREGGVVITSQSSIERDPITTPIPVASSHETVTTADRSGMHVGKRSTRMFQEFYMPDEVDTDARGVVWVEKMEQQLRRSQSVPADYHFFCEAEMCYWCQPTLVHSYSSPSSLATPMSEVECLLAELASSHDVGVVLRLLRQLRGLVKGGGVAVGKEVREGGGMEVLLEVLSSLCTNPVAMEITLRTLKYLTRQGGNLGDVASF